MAKRTAAAKARTVAKGHKHVKPAAAHHKAATGHAQKHHKAAKHHAAPKKHKGTVHRGLALGDAVACCSAEALAASLRLSGIPVADADVLALHRASGADDDAGVPILAALEAASEFGLAAVDELRYEQIFGYFHQDLIELPPGVGAGPSQDLEWVQPAQLDALVDLADNALRVHGLILGVDLPGPHTVLATPDGWWSWGELWCPCDFPDAVIEEAWEVSWGC